MLPPVRGTTTTTTPSSMAADPRYKLARLAEAHGILQRDHAGALERTTTAEAARKKLETALEARDIRIEELEDALTTLSEQARAFEASAREQRAKAEGRVAADALEAERHARQTAEASANEAAGALTRAGAECAAAVASAGAAAEAARAEAMAASRRADAAKLDLNERLREAELRAEASERREAQYARDAAAQKKKALRAEASLQKLNDGAAGAEAKARRAKELADKFKRAADEAKSAARERDEAAALEQRKKLGLAERLRLAVTDAEASKTKASSLLHASEARVGELEQMNEALAADVARLSTDLDALRALPRGPRFQQFVKLKENNLQLKERLQDHGIAPSPPPVPHNRRKGLDARRASGARTQAMLDMIS